MYAFLYDYYFPRLAQAKLSINLAKCAFFTPEVSVLGYIKGLKGIRPSEKKLNAFAKQPTLENEGELKRFIDALLQLDRFILGRVDKAKFLYTAVKKIKVQTSRKGKLVSEQQTQSFNQTPQHTEVFEALKKAVVEGYTTIGDPNVQQYLATDVSLSSIGSVLFQLLA